MRPSSRLALLVGLCATACSLKDFSSLNRCTGQPDSASCPLPSAQGGGSAGSSGSGGMPSGGTESGSGGDVVGGGAAGAGYDAAGQAGEGASGAPNTPSGLRALYAYSPNDPDTPMASKSIRADLEIVNDNPVDVPLAGITLRYYYTSEMMPNAEATCLSDEKNAPSSCSDVNVTFASYNSPSGLANAYFEVSFSMDPLDMLGANGGTSGRIKLSVQKPKFATQDVTNDYSCDVNVLTLTDWPKVTLHRDGQLLYGTPP